MCVCVSVCEYAYLYVCMYIYVCVCVYILKHVCIGRTTPPPRLVRCLSQALWAFVFDTAPADFFLFLLKVQQLLQQLRSSPRARAAWQSPAAAGRCPPADRATPAARHSLAAQSGVARCPPAYPAKPANSPAPRQQDALQ
jgi:hypothetical protein